MAAIKIGRLRGIPAQTLIDKYKASRYVLHTPLFALRVGRKDAVATDDGSSSHFKPSLTFHYSHIKRNKMSCVRSRLRRRIRQCVSDRMREDLRSGQSTNVMRLWRVNMFFHPQGELYCAPWEDVRRDVELVRNAVHRFSLAAAVNKTEASFRHSTKERSSNPSRTPKISPPSTSNQSAKSSAYHRKTNKRSAVLDFYQKGSVK